MPVNSRRSVRVQSREHDTHTEDSVTAKRSKTETKAEKKNDQHYDSFSMNGDIGKELENIEQNIEKPTELFKENDVDGKEMYTVLESNVKSNAMIEKAKMWRDQEASIRTPLKPKTKQVKVVVSRLKCSKGKGSTWTTNQKPNSEKNKNIAKGKKFSGNNVVHMEVSDDSSKRTKENKTVENCESKNNEEINNLPRLRSGRSRAINDYHLKSDEYFATQSEKSATSNNTLSKLKNRHIDEAKLQKLLANNTHISKEHQHAIQSLTLAAQQWYQEWMYIMEEGFTVLLYGFGSKRLLINNFREKMIRDEPSLVINGFFPSLTLKEILDNIIIELLGLETVSNLSECFDIIEKTMKDNPDDRIYLLIHNIDGGMLRSNKAQDLLSRLASIPNVHMLASIDHINAPLIWDNVKRARYNFYWMDVTTFLPYEAETSYESSLLVQKNGALALLSLQNVFASLTSNAKNIYIIIVKYQLENGGNNYTGMAFKDLYRASREAFLVSSDATLRAQLTEFLDHKLVRTKRNVDGVEHLIIPLDDTLLKQFLEQQDENS